MATPKHNRNLDILRAFAALIVVFYHLGIFSVYFDKHYLIGDYIKYNFPGPMAVIIFYILSGYVIGLNTPALNKTPLILDYVKKRLVRIVPIYFIVIIFTALAFGYKDWRVIADNLLFISVPKDTVMYEACPIWSLNYELFYYMLFIAFSGFRVNLKVTVGVLLGTIVLMFVFLHNVKVYPLIISYLVGFLFWITGAMMAQIKDWAKWEVSSSRIISVFVLIFCMAFFNPYSPLLKILHVPLADYSSYSWSQKSIGYSDLFYYPMTVMLILSLTHSYSKLIRYLMAFIFVACVGRVGMIVAHYGFKFLIAEHYLIPITFLLISISFWFFNFNLSDRIKLRLKSVASLSRISYAIYIVHMPVLFLFGKIPVSSSAMYFIKLVVFFAVILFVSYLLEEKLQPAINKYFKKKPVVTTPPAVL